MTSIDTSWRLDCEEIWNFSDWFARVKNKEGKSNFIDKNWDILFDIKKI